MSLIIRDWQVLSLTLTCLLIGAGIGGFVGAVEARAERRREAHNQRKNKEEKAA